MLCISTVGYVGSSTPPNLSTPPVVNPASYAQGYRYNIQGWIYVYIRGDAYERGYQHGYLLAAEIVDMLNRWSYMIHHYPSIEQISPRLSDERFHRVAQQWWDFCVQNCYRMYWDKYPGEYREEIQGIADGVAARGGTIHGRSVTIKDILTMNQMYEFMSKLTKIPKALHPLRSFFYQLQQTFSEFSNLPINDLLDRFLSQDPAHHCNGFIATGNATTHGQIVFTHSTICGGGMWWWTYFISLRWNVILDVHPTQGNRVIMSTSPGLIWSDEDYYQNNQGIMLLETTLPQGLYDNKGLPLSIRARKAIQYGTTIDDVIMHLTYQNDGSMNAVWLIGDSTTGEIARFELGYHASAVWRTMNGFFWSANNPYDLGVRLEKFSIKKYIQKLAWKLVGIPGYGYFSPRYHPEARDLKYEELGKKYYGRIDVDLVKELATTSPISDWITDIKITDTELVRNNGLWMFWGNPYKILNISRFDTRNQTIEAVPPAGWVQIYGVPEKHAFSLITQPYQSGNTTKILWKTGIAEQTNDFYSCAAHDGSVIYTATSENTLVALNMTTGTLLWKTSLGKNPVRPVVYQEYLYVGCADGLYAFTKDGKKHWVFSCEPICSPPVMYKDQILLGTQKGLLYGVSCKDGKLLWNISFPAALYLGSISNETLVVTSGMSCAAFTITNRSIRWWWNTTGIITSAPCISDTMVVVGSWDAHLYALDLNTGALIWKYETGWGFDVQPIVDETTVFVASADNNLYALNKTTGLLEWVFTANAAFHGQPCVYGDLVFAGCDDGTYYAVNRSTGKLVWRYTPGETIPPGSLRNYITTPLRSNPVVFDGNVICSALGSVVALDAQTDASENIPPSPPEHHGQDDETPDENPDEHQHDEPPAHEEQEHQDNTSLDEYRFIFLCAGLLIGIVITAGYVLRRKQRYV
ncbi:MAG: PQQ-binding-like beta-propeller repeat protein [Candidatus Thermoplasmatota archaeon]